MVDFSSSGSDCSSEGATLSTLEWFRTLERLFLGTLHVLFLQPALSIYRALTSETLHIIIKKKMIASILNTQLSQKKELKLILNNLS